MNILYCIIRDIDPVRANSGSNIRPLLMRPALEEVCDRVIVIDGGSENRKQLWQQIDYREFDAVYCELNTLPIALSDSDHIPRHPFMDIRFLRNIHRQGKPVTAFYRDIHWLYPGMVSNRVNPGTYLLMILHYLELRQLSSCIDHVFVPSMTMFDKLPTKIPRNHASALPPGARIRDGHVEDSTRIRLLYVGGVVPPLYDLRPMISAVANMSEIALTVCCREKDWMRTTNTYDIPENVTIVHKSGNDLDSLYQSSDAFLMYLKLDPDNYLQFAMPMKLFEAMGAGLPIITNKGTEMGTLIDRNDLGWTFDSEHNLEDFLRLIVKDRMMIREKRTIVEQARWNHTWNARARDIVKVLDAYTQ